MQKRVEADTYSRDKIHPDPGLTSEAARVLEVFYVPIGALMGITRGGLRLLHMKSPHLPNIKPPH